MPSVRLLNGLSEVADLYDAVFCDVWGVIHNGREAFPAACAALEAFREQGGRVILITNAPVPKDRVTSLMTRVGVPLSCYDEVATSGDATRQQLLLHDGPVFPIGVPGDVSVYEGLGVTLTDDPDDAGVICCTSLRDYPNDRPERYLDEMKALAGRGLEMICANPDVQFKHGDQLIWSAGALAEMFEEAGGTVIRPGKPDGAIYQLARTLLQQSGAMSIPDARVLAIGDGPATDIRGAMNEGLASLFIGNGIHGQHLGDTATFADDAARILRQGGVTATYVMSELA